MDNFLKFVGWGVIALGVIGGLAIGFTMSIQTPGLTEGYTYDDPHPLRWIYGLATIISSVVTGAVLLGISEIISTLNYRTHQMNDLNNRLKRSV
jgi:hypothetical protein